MKQQEPTVSTQMHGGTLVVTLTGELTMDRTPILSPKLRAQVEQHQPKQVVMELSGVPFIDSSGLAMLVELRKLQKQQGEVCLVGMLPDVARLVSIMKLDALFTVKAKLDEIITGE